MTNILALDTTMGACSAAIMCNGDLIENKKEIRARGHVERLLPMIDELFENTEIVLKDVDYIAATIGPGTFAGVRIGLSAAKGITLALNVSLIPISTFEAIAYEYTVNNVGYNGEICVVIDARRGELYTQSFNVSSGDIETIDDPVALPIDIACQKIGKKNSEIIGSGGSYLEGLSDRIEHGYDHPDARYIAELATKRMDRAVLSDDVSPLYLRAPDAVKPAPFSVTVTDE